MFSATRRPRKPRPPKSHVRIPGSSWTECYKIITKVGYGFDPKRHVYENQLADPEGDATCKSCSLRFHGRVPEAIIRRRQLRGLIYHVRHHPHGYSGKLTTGGRRIVGPANTLRANRPKGNCCWCFRPTETGKANWHRYCYAQWMMAAGNSAHEFKEYLPLKKCAECGEESRDLELDHKLAIGIAERSSFRVHIRSFAWGNLQWLCRKHHKAKTASDVRKMSKLDRMEKEQQSGLVRML